jgi:transcriptional regulator with XRE-family HTH domain
MASLDPAKVIRRVRQRLELSQEALSRLLNATKGAVQHWERGRNNPDLARLLALRQLCAPGPERRELDALIRQTQAQVAPLPSGRQVPAGKGKRTGRPGRAVPVYPSENFALLRREKLRLERQVSKLRSALDRRGEQLRILEDLATDLQRQMARLRAGQPDQDDAPRSPSPSTAS